MIHQFSTDKVAFLDLTFTLGSSLDVQITS